MKNTTLSLVAVAVLTVLLQQQPAHAYLDPGTGSYGAQVLLAGALVGLYSVKSAIRRFFEYVSQAKHSKKNS